MPSLFLCSSKIQKGGIRRRQVNPENQIKLSIVVHCFNEEKTLERCLQNALGIQDGLFSLEVIFVDDCSTDNSFKFAEEITEKHAEVTILHHTRNRGKGAALLTGFQHTNVQIVAIQDVDLEYDTSDLKRMIAPIIDIAIDRDK